MLSGRPLYDTAADSPLFVEPPAWPTLLRAIKRRNNVLISGGRGVGKTTVLRRLEFELRGLEQPVTFVDATGVDSPIGLLTAARQALSGRRSGAEQLAFTVGQLKPEEGSDPLLRHFEAELDALGKAPPTTFLVDASGSGAAVFGLFGRLRDSLWRLDHRWVVAVDDGERASVLRPPADAFFDLDLALDSLPNELMFELLRRREAGSELGESVLSAIVLGSNGVPRLALRAANEAAVSGQGTERAVDRQRLIAAAAALGQPYSHLMSELMDLGQASPSDDELARRLGLSRARITGLLRALLRAELVEAAPERSDRPGRPKTIYRPKWDVE